MSDNLSKGGATPSSAVEQGPLAVLDLSAQSRAGLKGPGAPGWLEAKLGALPAPNQATHTSCGQLLARLSPEEFVLLADASGDPSTEEKLALPAFTMDGDFEPGLVLVPREAMSAWLCLEDRGEADALGQLLSTLCGVDLRAGSFPPMSIAQTSLARTNAILIADVPAGDARRRLHLLCDYATAPYLKTVLAESLAGQS